MLNSFYSLIVITQRVVLMLVEMDLVAELEQGGDHGRAKF
jgi:hypothetical protein